MLKYPNLAGSSNGRTPPFEGGYLGSNPSPATVLEWKMFFSSAQQVVTVA